jgi:hypothetical protein
MQYRYPSLERYGLAARKASNAEETFRAADLAQAFVSIPEADLDETFSDIYVVAG